MGYAVIMFVVMLLMAVSIALSANYGISKDSEKAPLLAENAYAEREEGKMQTDLIIDKTKINGTALYTYPDGSNQPNKINLHLTIINNGSIVLDPREYSIVLNRWVWINSTSNNVTAPLDKSTTASLDLMETPASAPMRNLSLLVTTGNGIKIITPTSPMIRNDDVSVSPGNPSNCYWNLSVIWQPSYGEIWPIKYYKLYYMNNTGVSADIINKYDNDVSFVKTDNATTNSMIGNLFLKGGCKTGSGNPSYYIWVTATDTHGNEGPPSNTCLSSGGVSGNCNLP